MKVVIMKEKDQFKSQNIKKNSCKVGTDGKPSYETGRLSTGLDPSTPVIRSCESPYELETLFITFT